MGASLMMNVLALADTVGVKKGSYVDADRKCFHSPFISFLIFRRI